MSKKNQQPQQSNSHMLTHAAEYKIIKHDLLKVLGLNILYLGAVLAVYFANQKSHFLDNLFSRLFHF